MAIGKEVKTKIISIKSTQKITSAMEMVAASKMRRAQERRQLGKPYADRIRAVVGQIANAVSEYKHQYMEQREIKACWVHYCFYGPRIVWRAKHQPV